MINIKLSIRKFNEKSPFEILELHKNSSKKEIKQQYYKLARIYHPDINPNFSNKFTEINKAYAILMENSYSFNDSKTYDFNMEMMEKEKQRKKNEERREYEKKILKDEALKQNKKENKENYPDVEWSFKHYFAL